MEGLGIKKEILELVKQIRRNINRIQKQGALLQQLEKWLRITSALDVVEDTVCAIDYYCEQKYPEFIDGKYLFTYGLLQALFMQQDATESINAVLRDSKRINWEQNYPDAFAARKIRNDVAGHPTNRGYGNYIHLAQISMKKNSFWYINTNAENNKSEIIDVDVMKIIEDVLHCNKKVLGDVLQELEEEFIVYIDAHKDRKMQDIFSNLGYTKQKIFENDVLKIHFYNSTKVMVDKCEKELKLRYGSVENAESYKFLLVEVHELFDLIDNARSQILADSYESMTKYLLQCLFYKLEELESYCCETDEYFANYGEVHTIDCQSDLQIIITGADMLED
jgi:hypothetical protein